ncbi:hypothetical protein TRFO_25130 [Tritrichomonas foetus]|uniref:Uncharacterized protein n=1 Tax=Tritrichomonas foetus TaxID=1144522 RepID=A0A1J4K6L1_9EUKA|nr:hypothetical protein TRFO_25130 [Tritrichomonas foetus]|eukprot:OHT06819.1 hypothetical protein TRFO_25130 [Tritrichomonas foetus]
MGKDSKESKNLNQMKGISSLLTQFDISITGVQQIKTQLKNKKINTYTLIYTPVGYIIASKPNLMRKPKIYLTVSLFDIKGFEFVSRNQILFKFGKSSSLLVEIEEYTEFIKSIVTSHSQIFYRSPFFDPIDLKNFPNSNQFQQNYTIPPNIISMRYISLCLKYQQPVDPATKQNFERYEKSDRISLTFNSKCITPISYKIISLPLIHEPLLRGITFDSFASKIVCKILYHIMKHNKNILTAVLKNYDDLQYEQLTFSKLYNPSIVSWSFSNIMMKDQRLILLFNEFKFYHADILSLTLDRMHFTTNVGEKISSFLPAFHSFRTIESLDLTNIDSTGEDTNKILISFLMATTRLKSLQKLSVAGWTPNITLKSDTVKPIHFIKSTDLKYLKIDFADIRSFNMSVKFPAITNCFVFERCKFTGKSLFCLIKLLSDRKSQLILSLADMDIEQSEINKFYSQCSRLPIIENLVEFDYSGNQIPSSFVKEFCRIFITPKLKFLAINNVFGPDQVNDIGQILSACDPNNLWGLEMTGGLIKKTLGPKLKECFPFILAFTKLEHLNLSFQRFTAAIGPDLFQFLTAMKNIHYLSIDGTGINKLPVLYSLYEHIFFNTKIRAISRPFYDLDELISEGNFVNETATEKFQSLKQRMLTQMIPSSRYIRTFYYLRFSDMSHFQTFLSMFPLSVSEIPANDKYGINCIMPTSIPIRCISDYELNEVRVEEIGTYQTSLMNSPLDDVLPNTWELTLFTFPEQLKKYKGKYEYNENLTRPEFHKKVNTREAVQQYQDMIDIKNKKLFKNLTMIEDIYENVTIGDKNGGEIGKNLPTISPPILVSQKTYSTISEQVEALEDINIQTNIDINIQPNIDSNIQTKRNSKGNTISTVLSSISFNYPAENENSTSRPRNSKKSKDLYRSSSCHTFKPSSSFTLSGFEQQMPPLHSSGSEHDENNLNNKMENNSEAGSTNGNSSFSFTSQGLRRTSIVAEEIKLTPRNPKISDSINKFVESTKYGDYDMLFGIESISQNFESKNSNISDDDENEQLELLEDMINDTKQQEVLRNFRQTCTLIKMKYPHPKITLCVDSIPDDPPKADERMLPLWPFLKNVSHKHCRKINETPKVTLRTRASSNANSPIIKKFISGEFISSNLAPSPSSNLSSSCSTNSSVAVNESESDDVSSTSTSGGSIIISNIIKKAPTSNVTIHPGSMKIGVPGRGTPRQNSEISSGPLKLPPRLRTAPLTNTSLMNQMNPILSNLNSNLSANAPSHYFMSMGSENESSDDDLMMPAASDAFAVNAPKNNNSLFSNPNFTQTASNDQSGMVNTALKKSSNMTFGMQPKPKSSGVNMPFASNAFANKAGGVSGVNPFASGTNNNNGATNAGASILKNFAAQSKKPEFKQKAISKTNDISSESGEASDNMKSSYSGELSDAESVPDKRNTNTNHNAKENKNISKSSGKAVDALQNSYSGEASDDMMPPTELAPDRPRNFAQKKQSVPQYSSESGEASDEMPEPELAPDQARFKSSSNQHNQETPKAKTDIQSSYSGEASDEMPEPELAPNQARTNFATKQTIAQYSSESGEASDEMPEPELAPNQARTNFVKKQSIPQYSSESGEASDEMPEPEPAPNQVRPNFQIQQEQINTNENIDRKEKIQTEDQINKKKSVPQYSSESGEASDEMSEPELAPNQARAAFLNKFENQVSNINDASSESGEASDEMPEPEPAPNQVRPNFQIQQEQISANENIDRKEKIQTEDQINKKKSVPQYSSESGEASDEMPEPELAPNQVRPNFQIQQEKISANENINTKEKIQTEDLINKKKSVPQYSSESGEASDEMPEPEKSSYEARPSMINKIKSQLPVKPNISQYSSESGEASDDLGECDKTNAFDRFVAPIQLPPQTNNTDSGWNFPGEVPKWNNQT